MFLALPSGFPHHYQPTEDLHNAARTFSKVSFHKIDLLGATVLLAATVLLVAAFQQAGVEFPWRSAFVVCLLVTSGLLWLAFIGWEWWVTRVEGTIEPIFPWRFLKSRIWMGLLL